MAQDLEASHINHIAPRTAVNSKFPCVAMVWRLDWDAKSGFALRSIQQTPRVDRPPATLGYASLGSLPATQGQRWADWVRLTQGG